MNLSEKNYSHTICYNIWNKLIRTVVLIKMYNYICVYYYKEYIITSDDILMNIIAYQFANNYPNYFLTGYLYVIRRLSMSRGEGGKELNKLKRL